jgi:hypothetical protein
MIDGEYFFEGGIFSSMDCRIPYNGIKVTYGSESKYGFNKNPLELFSYNLTSKH